MSPIPGQHIPDVTAGVSDDKLKQLGPSHPVVAPEKKIQQYVLGIAMNPAKTRVVVIQKKTNDPAISWQNGLYNGIGGKIEEGETALQAMIREFQEETGVKTLPEDWNTFIKLKASNYEVFCFWMLSDKIYQCRTTTKEEVVIEQVWDIHDENTINSFQWLMEMVHDPDSPRMSGEIFMETSESSLKIANSEALRLNFLTFRDGDEAAEEFATRTIKAYRKHVLGMKARHFPNDIREGYIISYLVMKTYLELRHDRQSI